MYNCSLIHVEWPLAHSHQWVLLLERVVWEVAAFMKKRRGPLSGQGCRHWMSKLDSATVTFNHNDIHL